MHVRFYKVVKSGLHDILRNLELSPVKLLYPGFYAGHNCGHMSGQSKYRNTTSISFGKNILKVTRNCRVHCILFWQASMNKNKP